MFSIWNRAENYHFVSTYTQTIKLHSLAHTLTHTHMTYKRGSIHNENTASINSISISFLYGLWFCGSSVRTNNNSENSFKWLLECSPTKLQRCARSIFSIFVLMKMRQIHRNFVRLSSPCASAHYVFNFWNSQNCKPYHHHHHHHMSGAHTLALLMFASTYAHIHSVES